MNNKDIEHIGIIMDGNGRWAKKLGKERNFGHKCGVNSVEEAINGCLDLGVKYLTLYTFSTENNNRPQSEVSALMDLSISSINEKINLFIEKKVKFSVIGDMSKLDPAVVDCFHWIMEETKDNDAMTLIIAMNYSSRDEIVRAVKVMASEVILGTLNVDDINEKMVSNYLDTKNLPDPDLIIRTGGEFRLSNFLLWQASYSELIFLDILWPDFKKADLFAAVEEYNKRDRRFGKLSNND